MWTPTYGSSLFVCYRFVLKPEEAWAGPCWCWRLSVSLSLSLSLSLSVLSFFHVLTFKVYFRSRFRYVSAKKHTDPTKATCRLLKLKLISSGGARQPHCAVLSSDDCAFVPFAFRPPLLLLCHTSCCVAVLDWKKKEREREREGVKRRIENTQNIN